MRTAQILGTVILTGLLLRGVEWPDLRALFAEIAWFFLGLGVILVLMSHLLTVARWQYLLKPHSISYRRLLAVYGAGLFSNNLLPTGIGGDGVRVALLRRDVPLRYAIFSVSLDRVVGLTALGIFVLPGFWFGLPPNIYRSALDRFLNAWLVLPIVALVIMVVLGIVVAWNRLKPERRATFRGLIIGDDSAETSTMTGFEWLYRLGGGYGISLLSHLALIAAYCAAGRAVGVPVGAGPAIWLVLLGSASLLAPIAFNGLGLQEGIYVATLTQFDVNKTSALALALLIRALMIFFSLLGAFISLNWDFSREQST